jgi:hypothetical protein
MARLCSARGIRPAVPLFLLTLALLALNGAGTAAEAREFPSYCGGEGERPCTIFEHIPSCMSGLVEHFGLNKCIRLDSDGYPTFCGGPNERACTVVEHIPSCKSGLDEIPFPGGTCVQRDSQGFPPGCGHLNQDACALDLQIRFGIRSCSSGLIEVPFPGGTCIQPDAEGFPPFCGGESERACTVVEHIPSCKAGLAESLTTLPDGTLVSTCVGPPPACGRNGQRPCLIVEHIPSCQPGLAELPFEFGVCGADPVARGESDASERPHGGRRTLFFIHGGYTDLGDDLSPGAFLEAVHAGAPNVKAFYGVDWNHGGDGPRKLRTIQYFSQTCGFMTNCVRDWGEESFDAGSFRITDIAYALNLAIKELPSEGDITIVAHGFGGILARQLVYRHYDEIRAAGKRIAEVITIGAPNRGVLAGALEIELGEGASLQTDAACLTDPLTGRMGDHTGCQFGTWIDWMKRREDGTWPFEEWSIDDRNYPQIRWIAMAGSGWPLQVDEALARARAADTHSEEYAALLERVKFAFPFIDSDGLVTVQSALEIGLDECFPFTRQPDLFGSQPRLARTQRLYEYDHSGATVVRSADSVVCQNERARVDPRVREASAGPSGPADQLDFVNHAALLQNRDVQNFVIAALNLHGDTNGDGVVTGDDLTAHAGPDQTIECGGPLTQVALDGSASNVPGDPAVYTWTGPFGTAAGAKPVVTLPRGTHILTLRVEAAGVHSTDQVVVTIVDTTPPVLGTQNAYTVEATSASLTPFAFVVDAMDACGAVMVSREPDQAAYPLGDTSVAVTATDESGNAANGSITVSVVDTTPPALIVPPDLEVVAEGPATTIGIGVATASDLFGATVSNDAPAAFPLGTTMVTWTAVDGNGNTASAVQQVHAIYGFAGFGEPIQPGGVYKANRTLPLKFALAFADGRPVADAIAALSVTPLGDDGVPAPPLDISASGLPDSGMLFRYTDDHYHYNLSTSGWAPGRYRISVTLNDGRIHSMDISLR